MAIIINTSIKLSDIPHDKIIVGKKGKYLPITITVNDELDKFGNQGPVVVAQTKEEREAKKEKTYLGNVNVAWTNGVIKKLEGKPPEQAANKAPANDRHLNTIDSDLPF
tara:strand:- start:817 stop:1143 length:327 start_codon:yes stop_codon:yes gene_type:complete